MDPRRNCEPLAALLRGADTVALVSHLSPDGDTVGTALALAFGLEQLGKQVTLICRDKIPDNLGCLPGVDRFRPLAEVMAGTETWDVVMTVDVSAPDRIDDRGEGQAILSRGRETALIDHHGTNPGFAHVCDIDGDSPACAVVAAELLRTLGIQATADIAGCLYAAMATDTGNFSYASTNAETFGVMERLMATGFPLPEISRSLRVRPRGQVALLQRALAKMTFLHNGQATVMTLTAKDFEECGALPEHADTIVNFGLDIVGVEMAVLCREIPGGVKLSLRSAGKYRVDRIASRWNGGGHPLAAGCTLRGMTLAQAAEQAGAALTALLDGEAE